MSFDFDGVFVRDSDAIFKKEAWKITLAPWEGRYEPYKREASELYGSGKNGGRMEIMRHTFEELGIPEEEIPVLVAERSQVFDQHVQSRILAAGLVPGTREALQKLSGLGVEMYLNSGTATPALVTSARNLNIANYFKGILGSTPEPYGGSKVENLAYIATREGITAPEILMVGDGDPDWKAPQDFDCPFLGFGNVYNRWADDEKLFPVITDLRDVMNYL